MKTENTQRTPAAQTRSTLEALGQAQRALAGRAASGNGAERSFRALFADIKPASFEDMTQKMVARQQEQQRLARERQQQRPREEDALSAPQATRQMSAAEPARPRDAGAAAVRKSADAETARPRRSERQGTDEKRAAPAPAERGRNRQAPAPRPDAPATTRTETAQDAGRADDSQANDAAQAVGASEAAAGTAHKPTTDVRDAQATRRAAATQVDNANGQPAQDSEGAQDVGTNAAAQTHQAAGARTDDTASGLKPVTDDEAQQLAEALGVDPTTASAADASAQTTRDTQLPGVQAQLQGNAGGPEGEAGDKAVLADLARPDLSPAATTASARPGTEGGSGNSQGRHPGAHPALPDANAARMAVQAEGTAVRVDDKLSASALQAAQGTRGENGPQTAAPTPGTAGVATRTDGTPFTLGAALPAASTHSPVRTDGSPLLASRIDSPVHSAEFKEQFARHMAGLVIQGQDRAEIRLTPAELGPIRIRVSLSGDDAQLDISAAHAATRAAIESSMSTLKQLLAEQGFRLTEHRMDQGASFLAQHRQSGQDPSAGMQHPGSAFGQNASSQHGGDQGRGAPSPNRGGEAIDARQTADSAPANGARRGAASTLNGRLDLFA